MVEFAAKVALNSPAFFHHNGILNCCLQTMFQCFKEMGQPHPAQTATVIFHGKKRVIA